MERVMKLSNEQKYRLLEQAEPNELKRLYEMVEKVIGDSPIISSLQSVC